ncbi:MAG: UDP-glucose/GDP-mannose dehydrogenase family protein [Hyphomicrobiales bacterium]|nr:UDP-glucose/GDP-mannose dehydrogenase family protein [Hyphomicrobiales bacterium]MDE2114116.1 UDP-glucose/GDP-mannose dehydrogenase family protein [Hyphomicrobiales bacterium]
MQIAIVGAGYVGLVSGACLADFGHSVICVDHDGARIRALQALQMPIYEPGLEALVQGNVAAQRLSFSLDLVAAVQAADVVFIAVGTPSRRGDGHADLSYVFAAAREVAAALRGPTVIVTKSTVPVGTGDQVEAIIRGLRPEAEFEVVSNPEFLREGAAIRDFKLPDRIVIGTQDARAREIMEAVYRPLYLNQAPLLFTTRRTAELIKYAANAFLATKIGFINEMADLCESVGANVQEVARGIGLDRRIGPKFLNAGPGFGGSCFPKDLLALLQMGREHRVPLHIVETVASANDARKAAMAQRVVAACNGSVMGKRIAILGLAFKPNTDDMRESPALYVVNDLVEAGAEICAYDPQSMTHARAMLPQIEYAADPYSCLNGADALVIVTEWEPFRALDLSKVRKLLKVPLVVDLRNIYRAEDMARHGFVYFSIGRGKLPEDLRANNIWNLPHEFYKSATSPPLV